MGCGAPWAAGRACLSGSAVGVAPWTAAAPGGERDVDTVQVLTKMSVIGGLQVLTRRAAPGARKPSPFVSGNLLPANSFRTIVVPRVAVIKDRRLTTAACEGWLTWYAGLLERRPLTTKMITNGFLAACGDFACQVCVGPMLSL